jgi:hypothetical protein
MEQMPKFSTADLATPTITYAGRLADSRKGVELFFDALELFWSGSPAAAVAVWIIGGDASEIRRAKFSAASRPNVKAQLQDGRVTFWGRVDHNALPELYSRSMVVVVPSFREQFGMVAVEAMMCGCAVIASRVGGLQDVVVHGHTGTLIDRGNAAALAACLSSYVAVPELAHWQGQNGSRWARARFDLRHLLPAVEATLTADAGSPATNDYTDLPETAFVAHTTDRLKVTAERLLGRASFGHVDLTSSQSISFRLDLDDGTRAFVKQYSRRPRFLDTIHGANAVPAVADPATYRLALMRRLAGQPYLPQVIETDDDSGIIVQQWVDVVRNVDFGYTAVTANKLCDEISKTALLSDEQIHAFSDATSPLATLDLLLDRAEVRRSFDQEAAELHRPLFDGVVACRRMHPQIELLRITEYLERSRAWLPRQYVVRAEAEIRRVLHLRNLVLIPPAFAHGSFKTEHVLAAGERDYICDFDHAGYFIGPIDLTHWLWDHWEHDPLASRAFRLGDLLREYMSGDNDRYLAICWLLAFRLNKDLVFITRGEWGIIDHSMSVLWSFGDTIARAGLLR